MKRSIFDSEASLQKAIDGFFDDRLDMFRAMNELIIFRNLLYYEGHHYIEFLRSTQMFRRRSIPVSVPKPVSNDIREYVRSVKAMLMNQKMVPRVWPSTNEKEDIQAAELGEQLSVYLDQANDASFFDEKELLCIWLPIAGTVCMRTFPDSDGGMWMPEGGKTGDVATECVLPFNIRLDTMGSRLKDKRWVGIQTLKDREWVEDTFKTKVENKNDSPIYIDYQKKLATMVGNVSELEGATISPQAFSPENDDLVLFREVEFKPTQDYKQGRYAVSCGGKVLHIVKERPEAFFSDRLPIQSSVPKDDDDKPLTTEWNYTLTDFHFNHVPGRFWSSGGVNDLISPQNIINQIDQAYAINRKGLGRPRIVTPAEIGLKRIGLGGEAFLQLSYNPIMGQKPEISAGVPLTKDHLNERMVQKEQFQDSSGDPKNVLRGQQPSANASGILTQELRETAEQGKEPDLDRFNRSLSRVYKKRLLIVQEIWPEERMIKVAGRGNTVKIRKFKGADLRGNTDVRLEPDSGLIKTKSGQAGMIVNLVQAGFFKEDGVSPSTRQEVLTRLGMTGFSKEIDVDVERAEAENISMASGGTDVMTTAMEPVMGKEGVETQQEVVVTDDPLFGIDNHATHYDIHRADILSAEFKERPMEYQVVALKHAEAHKGQIEQAPPDIREFVQYDKLLPLLTVSERAQLLQQMGIQAGTETEAGIPTSDVVVKSKEKLMQTDRKEATKKEQFAVTSAQKDRAMDIDLLKAGMVEGNKQRALQ
jgi:hypothetical protein